MTDIEYMQKALSLAQRGKGFTSPNPCVGAVVVKDGRIVGKGFHLAAGLPHAEVEALNDAGSNARGATIYVTLEPCTHFGKTPPCTQKIIKAGIKKVVVGCKDPNLDVCGGGIEYLRNNGIEVVTGILDSQAKILIEDFIWYTRNDKKPFVILKCASTLDGRIATSTGDSKWITNEKSREFVHKIRHEVDAILVGSGTLHADDPSLTSRIKGVKTKDPLRIILDTHLSIKKDAKVLTQKSDARTIIITSPDVSKEKIVQIENQGALVIQIPLKKQKLDLNKLMIKLGQM
jgi:diaminohydroxyphosphoribosylaminopyrimidine deaminase/5-amino-6-(5-phosphoribosylamino)uracil reductase